MESVKGLKGAQIIVLGICIAAATIVSSAILSKGLIRMKQFSEEVIDVTGSAEKKIVSDYIVWRSSFSRRDPEQKTAYAALQSDLKKVKAYLNEKQVSGEEIIVSQIGTEVLYKKNEKGYDTNEIEGYRLRQAIEARSFDVKKIEMVSRQATELIDQGVQFISGIPEYFYTGLAELKIEMLSNATANAKQRAESIASSAGNKIGLLRSARMGIFQITPVNSYDVSWYGNNDTSSYEKKVMAVVNASFAISD